MYTHHITLGNQYDNALCNYTIFPANHTLIPNQIYLKKQIPFPRLEHVSVVRRSQCLIVIHTSRWWA